MKAPKLKTYLLGSIIAVLAASPARSATVIADYSVDYLTTAQGSNGWNYLSALWSEIGNDPSTFALMTYASTSWEEVYGGQAAMIGQDFLSQSTSLYPVVTWTATSSYVYLTIALNGMSVNSDGRGYVSLWDDSADTWTTLLTLEGGNTYSNALEVNNLEAGDRIAFMKQPGWGTNEAAITNFSPVLSVIPEPSALIMASIGCMALVCLRRGRACSSI